jgi:hypothetical protein
MAESAIPQAIESLLRQSKYYLQQSIDLPQDIRFQFPSNRHQPQPSIDDMV